MTSLQSLVVGLQKMVWLPELLVTYAMASSCLVWPCETHIGAPSALVGPTSCRLVMGGWEYTATWLLVKPAALAVIYAMPVLFVGMQVV
jgi:hypothetical protein